MWQYVNDSKILLELRRNLKVYTMSRFFCQKILNVWSDKRQEVTLRHNALHFWAYQRTSSFKYVGLCAHAMIN